MKYPTYQIMGNAKMPDGRDVMIMSPEQWNTYCFNFNQLNGVPQPQKLLDDIRTYQEQAKRRRIEMIEA